MSAAIAGFPQNITIQHRRYKMSYYDFPEFEYDKDLDINVDTDISFDTSVTLDVYKDVVVYTEVYTDVEGNSAFATVDVEAIGYDTFSELDLSVLAVEGQLSSVTATASAVVG
jgi:hypothetical protein